MSQRGQRGVRSWEVLVRSQEELAWFRDNLARVLTLLGYGELQSHLFAAQVAQDGYQALDARSDSVVCFLIYLDHEPSHRRICVDAACEQASWVAASRQCRWPLPARSSLDFVDGSTQMLEFVQLCERVGQQLQRKCRTQMHREMLEQNQELKRQLQAVNVAERAAEAKGAFLASMSHELRTPMNSILGFTRRLRRRLDGKIDEKDLQALDVVRRNGNHLLSMINDILDFSKLEAEQEVIDLKAVSPSDVVQTVLLQCDPLLREGQALRFHNSLRSSLQIQADESKLGQILTNLVSNAIKYGGTAAIDVRVDQQVHPQVGAAVVIQVIDQGKGMSQEEQAKIFTPFTRLDNDTTRAASGTGLGLSIASRYAKMHEGLLEVKSELGRGTTFFVVLPETLAPANGGDASSNAA